MVSGMNHEPIYYNAAPNIIGGCTCGRVRLPGEWGNEWWKRHAGWKPRNIEAIVTDDEPPEETE